MVNYVDNVITIGSSLLFVLCYYVNQRCLLFVMLIYVIALIVKYVIKPPSMNYNTPNCNDPNQPTKRKKKRKEMEEEQSKKQTNKKKKSHPALIA